MSTYKSPEGDFEITSAVVPEPETSTVLDELIRALDEGDGATLQDRGAELRACLVELRRYREVLSCSVCKRTVLGREPVCGGCAAAVKVADQWVKEHLAPFKGRENTPELRAEITQKIEELIR